MIDHRNSIEGAGADVSMGGDRGLVTAAALREGRQPLDIVPPAGKAAPVGRGGR